jgi:hypothetical protein
VKVSKVPSLVKKILVLIMGLIPISNNLAYGNEKAFADHRPMLLKGKNYTELWEQFFIFEDGSLYSSQIVIGNFPFMQQHSFLQSSLLLPSGKRIIIQNGRGTDKWSFDKNRLNIKMFNGIFHNLQGEYPEYSYKIKNDEAVIDLTLTSTLKALPLKAVIAPKGRLLTSLYAPHWDVQGKWHRSDEEVWKNLGKGQGFGIHSLIHGEAHKIAKDFIRLFGLPTEKSVNKNKIILMSILGADDKRSNNLFLFEGSRQITGFKNTEVVLTKFTQDNSSEIPTEFKIKSQNSEGILEGTVRFTKQKEYFLLNEHISMIEQIIARIFPKFHRYRYQMAYDLTYMAGSVKTIFKGTGFGEYTKIIAPSFKKTRRRKR